MSPIDDDLLEEQIYTWTEMHKKSAVSFLILTALSTRPMWSAELEEWLQLNAGWDISERSLYRVLRRLERQGNIAHDSEPAERTGAERKVFIVTPGGNALLGAMRTELQYLVKLSKAR